MSRFENALINAPGDETTPFALFAEYACSSRRTLIVALGSIAVLSVLDVGFANGTNSSFSERIPMTYFTRFIFLIREIAVTVHSQDLRMLVAIITLSTRALFPT